MSLPAVPVPEVLENTIRKKGGRAVNTAEHSPPPRADG